MIETKAYARAGLLGNPSDGYFGKTIAITIKNFSAQVFLEKKSELLIIASDDDQAAYKSLSDLNSKIDLYGYYGGVRLIKAAIKLFYAYCVQENLQLSDENFCIRYQSDIPRQLGLGGSSAIITAVMQALLQFYSVEIPKQILPSLILQAELEELGINAGYMDRVIQVYEGCVYMDLDQDLIQKRGYGVYESLNPDLLPPLYLAYKPQLGKVSGRVLNDIRLGYDQGDPFVIDTLKQIAKKAQIGKQALIDQNLDQFFCLMNENFDLRSQIMQISKSNIQLIQTARNCGASAKFAGSGGSIIGMVKNEDMYSNLVEALNKLGAVVIKPVIA